jgi:hippurate hydrolase
VAVYNRIADFHDDLKRIRRDIHAHPETAFEEERTAKVVADELASYGMDVHTGLAKTGVVGTLKVGTSDRTIGLRADMDALDLYELNEFDHKSVHNGKMHGCGHDGHTTMLLGAARYLAETKNFDGTVHFIFQPAEENVAGGRVMVQDGLFDMFNCQDVYGMHNSPGLPVGTFLVNPGPMMASADFFEVRITGVGAHGAFPHQGNDPVVIAAQMITAFQTVAARRTDPLDSVVVSVTQVHAGHTTNVIPEDAVLSGTTRALKKETQDMIEREMRQIAEGIGAAFGAHIEFTYDRRYLPTINTPAETEFAAEAVAEIVGSEHLLRDQPPVMGAEDFSWMLAERPGCYIRIGNGVEGGPGGCHVHNPNYDFNDEILTIGASYWSKLVEMQLGA